MSSDRMGMVCSLAYYGDCFNHNIRKIADDDAQKVAKTMFEAYLGTVDQQEDSYEEALVEVMNIFNDGYGKFIYDASFIVEKDNEAASVILINIYEGKPLVTEIFTVRDCCKQGMAGELLRASMNALYRMGYKELVLYVKRENINAIKLYEKIGFKAVL